MEDLADLDAATMQVGAAASMSETMRYRPWAEPGAAGVTFLPKMTEAGGARGRELDDAEVVAVGEVGVEPPAEVAIETLGAIDVRNGDDDDLELHVDRRPPSAVFDGGSTADLSGHGWPPEKSGSRGWAGAALIK